MYQHDLITAQGVKHTLWHHIYAGVADGMSQQQSKKNQTKEDCSKEEHLKLRLNDTPQHHQCSKEEHLKLRLNDTPQHHQCGWPIVCWHLQTAM